MLTRAQPVCKSNRDDHDDDDLLSHMELQIYRLVFVMYATI